MTRVVDDDSLASQTPEPVPRGYQLLRLKAVVFHSALFPYSRSPSPFSPFAGRW